MAEVNGYKLATDADFDAFINQCDNHDGWTVVVDKADLRVWEKKSDLSPINIVKLHATFATLDPDSLYDTLHDPDYRAVWDENMVEGVNIEQLDPTNDVGYYSAKAPPTVTNRDFCNQRSWRAREGPEYIIMNHTVTHPKCPEKKNFVRANSICTGYLIRARREGGCTLSYMTQTDPKGWIPAWLVNKVTTSFAPKIVDKLLNASANYNAWKAKHSPEEKPWRTGRYASLQR